MRYLIILLALFVAGCVSTYSFKPLSSFNIDHNALKDGDTIKVLYSSGGPDDNYDKEYLYHLIVTSVDEQDTFNVLVPDISSLKQENNIKTFISSEGEAYKFLLLSDDDRKKVKNIEELKGEPIERVISNREFPGANDNKYPTVIGMLGELMDSLPDDIQRVVEQQAKRQNGDSAVSPSDSL
jgi:hypothetical protein